MLAARGDFDNLDVVVRAVHVDGAVLAHGCGAGRGGVAVTGGNGLLRYAQVLDAGRVDVQGAQLALVQVGVRAGQDRVFWS